LQSLKSSPNPKEAAEAALLDRRFSGGFAPPSNIQPAHCGLGRLPTKVSAEPGNVRRVNDFWA
jgi:hypothetical protein